MAEQTIFQPSTGALPPGTQLNGIYEIDAHLASGGMGDVYRGHELQTGEPVAIKVIRTDLADNESALALFKREATALNRLHHEAIVRYYVFSLDPILRRHYLAMELVEGLSLGDIIRSSPLQPSQALSLLRRVAAGLGAAHERGIVHRDISPDNIIVSQGDFTRARIIDFGIARSTRIGDGTVLGGGFAGKYNYVSPEQLGLSGGEVTGRSDMYSLGLVIAQALIGKPIDMGGSQVDIIDKRRKVPDLSGIDGSIRPLLERMLQPDPADRFATMQELVEWRGGADAGRSARKAAPPPPTRPEQQRPGERAPDKAGGGKGIFIALALLVLGGVSGFVGWLTLPDRQVVSKAPEITLPPLKDPNPSQTPEAKTPPTGQPDKGQAGTGTQTTTDIRPPIDCSQPQIEKEAIIAWTEKCGKKVETPPAKPSDVVIVEPPVKTPDPVPVPPQPPVRIPPEAPVTEKDVRTYVQLYDAGECTALFPTKVTDKSADIDGYGTSDKPFIRFDKDFMDVFKWEASIGVRLLKQSQCAAMPFLARVLRDGNANLSISATPETLKSRDMLSGTVESRTGHSMLLLVDDDGDVHDITSQATGDPARKTFRLRLELRAGAPSPAPILLIAVTGADLPALKGASNASGKVAFPKALEQLGKSTTASVALKYVTLVQ